MVNQKGELKESDEAAEASLLNLTLTLPPDNHFQMRCHLQSVQHEKPILTLFATAIDKEFCSLFVGSNIILIIANFIIAAGQAATCIIK